MKKYQTAHAFTARIDIEDWKYVYSKGRGSTFNSALRYFIHIVRDMEAEGLAELRGYFQANEWKFMADVLKNNTEPIWSKNELARRIMDVRNLEAKASWYAVTPATLVDKITGLNSLHVLAITQRIHEFWVHSDSATMDDWAQY